MTSGALSLLSRSSNLFLIISPNHLHCTSHRRSPSNTQDCSTPSSWRNAAAVQCFTSIRAGPAPRQTGSGRARALSSLSPFDPLAFHVGFLVLWRRCFQALWSSDRVLVYDEIRVPPRSAFVSSFPAVVLTGALDVCQLFSCSVDRAVGARKEKLCSCEREEDQFTPLQTGRENH